MFPESDAFDNWFSTVFMDDSSSLILDSNISNSFFELSFVVLFLDFFLESNLTGLFVSLFLNLTEVFSLTQSS